MGKTDIVICSSEHVKLSLLDFSADEQKSHSHTPALKEINVSSTSPHRSTQLLKGSNHFPLNQSQSHFEL